MIDKNQRQQLRKEAHHLKPVTYIGAKELSESVLMSIKENFNTRELLKIKVNRDDNQNKTIVNEIAEEINKKIKCETVSIIGSTIILFKKREENSKRKIKK